MYVASATAAQNGVRTHLLAAPLPQPHQCEQVHLIQRNSIDSGTIAAAVAAPCERTLKRWCSTLLPTNPGSAVQCVPVDLSFPRHAGETGFAVQITDRIEIFAL